ncbi:unnamed protein product [Closterium sp. Naga37s-1]|nr:unnamed protein product [Closterium sp. Naga37s-1]
MSRLVPLRLHLLLAALVLLVGTFLLPATHRLLPSSPPHYPLPSSPPPPSLPPSPPPSFSPSPLRPSMSSPSLFPQSPTPPAAYPPLTRALLRRLSTPFAARSFSGGAEAQLQPLAVPVRLVPSRLKIPSPNSPLCPPSPRVQKIVYVKVVYVGGSSNRLVSPWGFAMKDWKAPKVLPGDSLVFQWTGEVHSVHKVSAAEYAACTFVKAKQLARNRNYGSYWYKVNWREFGKTIYFSSKANKDCSLGIKVAFVVGT